MSLNFDYSRVAGPTTDPTDPDKVHPVLYQLIWATVVVDIGEITEKTANEFAFRYGLYQRLKGAALRTSDSRDVYITLDDVKQYIGLRTNVFTETRPAWMRRFCQMATSYPVVNNRCGMSLPPNPTAIQITAEAARIAAEKAKAASQPLIDFH